MVSEQTHPTPRISGKSKDELASIAYAAVKGIEFLEMNDGNRLGYHLYLYLNGESPSIAEAIYESKSRTSLHPNELERILSERLTTAGVA